METYVAWIALDEKQTQDYLAGYLIPMEVRETEHGIEALLPVSLLEKVRSLLSEYDDTVSTPGQAKDIAEKDLLDALQNLLH